MEFNLCLIRKLEPADQARPCAMIQRRLHSPPESHPPPRYPAPLERPRRLEPQGLTDFQKITATRMDNIFQGTNSPMNLEELDQYLGLASGSSRGHFRMDKGLLGKGMKPAKK